MYYLVTNEATEPVTTTLSGLTEKSLNILFGTKPIPVVGGKVTLGSRKGVLVLSSANSIARRHLQMGYLVPYSKIPPPNPKLNLLKQANWIWFPNEHKIPNSKCHMKRHSHSTNSQTRQSHTTMPTISSKTSKSTERQSKESTQGQRILRHREAP